MLQVPGKCPKTRPITVESLGQESRWRKPTPGAVRVRPTRDRRGSAKRESQEESENLLAQPDRKRNDVNVSEEREFFLREKPGSKKAKTRTAGPVFVKAFFAFTPEAGRTCGPYVFFDLLFVASGTTKHFYIPPSPVF